MKSVLRKLHRITITRSSGITILAIFALTLVSCKEKSADQSYASQETVILQVDMPGDTKDLRLKSESSGTVLSVMDDLKKSKELAFVLDGSGETAFVTSIQHIKNQGQKGANWIYSVNGKNAPAGVGTMKVSDTDTITWCYLPYNGNDYPECPMLPREEHQNDL